MQSCRLVAQYDDDIAGWAALSPVSHRKVYSGLAEVSIYVSSKYRGAGVGLMLLKKLIAVSEENGIWLLQAGIIANNFASISLHEKAGFRLVGYREKLGKLNGCWLDVVVLEKRSQRVGIE